MGKKEIKEIRTLASHCIDRLTGERDNWSTTRREDFYLKKIVYDNGTVKYIVESITRYGSADFEDFRIPENIDEIEEETKDTWEIKAKDDIEAIRKFEEWWWE